MKKKDEIKVKFEPITKPCTYYHPDKNGVCKNCNGTRVYRDGYFLIYEINGKKFAWQVDTMK